MMCQTEDSSHHQADIIPKPCRPSVSPRKRRLNVNGSSTPDSTGSPAKSRNGSRPSVSGVRCFGAPRSISGTPVPQAGTLFTDGRTPVVDRPDHPTHYPTGSTEVLTFYPTLEEFRDFPAYIKKIEAESAHVKCGICKVVPPEGWHPRPSKHGQYGDVDDYVITTPVKEKIEGKSGIFRKTVRTFRKQMSVKEYRQMALSAAYANPHPDLSGKDLETHFFKNILLGEPVYGADTEGSIYDKNVNEFNMNRLNTILDEIKATPHAFSAKDKDRIINGVNTVYLYFGMYKAMFPWHVEDMDLYSINYLHFGAPKYWFAISSESADRFERLMGQCFPHDARSCKAFMRHKAFIMNTSLLKAHNIPYGTMTQHPNEFIITFPRGYHMGFNLGYNCAESTNFASDRWIDFGKNAILCHCRNDSVEIDMRPYMKKYRKHEFEKWNAYWYEPRVPTKTTKKTAAAKRAALAAASTPKGRTNGDPANDSSPGARGNGNQSRVDGGHGKKSTKKNGSSDPVLSRSGMIRLRGEDFRINYSPLLSSTVNFAAECERNVMESHVWPHCAVCQYFYPKSLPLAVVASEIPQNSKRLVTRLYLHKSDPADYEQEPDPNVDMLVTCRKCSVTVHPTCYSFTPKQFNAHGVSEKGWLCQRCRTSGGESSVHAAACSLCELRGGALVNCRFGDDPGFVHVICAIMSRRTAFNVADTFQSRHPGRLPPICCYSHPPPKQGPLNGILRYLPSSYVVAADNELEVAKFECDICGLSREGLIRCAACNKDDIPTLAHATCAREAGFSFEFRRYPLVTAMVCDKHTEDSDDDDNLEPLFVNEEVLAYLEDDDDETKPAIVRKGTVTKIYKSLYAVVDFMDGTQSVDTPSGDIVACECERALTCHSGRHAPGSKVQVRWNDGRLWSGFYRRAREVTVHVVQMIPDGALMELERSRLYGTVDAVPNEVRKLLKRSNALVVPPDVVPSSEPIMS